ncbi:MAG: amidophosphoribosyltransferase [Clostridia bacterium]|nr:amidophosphoribosyltransferase [Clostridia bacterium]MBP5592736.1 amidophosphoribosyltransferase [Clostridia bacterium]MBP5648861.1 amidophosphoribosyltransferase [Clostridia bacterium]
MGGFFGMTSKRDCIVDVFFGTDYHSHLGTHRAGMAAYDKETGLQREIHSIENSPFRTKFSGIAEKMRGTSAIGCISDFYPQPLLVRSNLGTYAICVTGVVNNSEALIHQYLSFSGGHFDAMTGGKVNTTELVAALINQKNSFRDGILFAQKAIDGTASILILKDDGKIIAARDRFGRLPMLIGKGEDGYCVTFEHFAYRKLGYEDERDLGPGEIVELSPDGIKQLARPGKEMKMCSFLWSYYGYPTSTYEGVNVEIMRYKNGGIMAKNDAEIGNNKDVDYICGVPDSGTPHAIGYANKANIPFARPYIKYTPSWSRSFMPPIQTERERIAKMKQIPVHELIENKSLLFVDDSIVRGTQLKETVEFLYKHGAKAVHMRSACPPIMYGCKFLNFSRATSDMELLARRTIVELEGMEGLEFMEEYSRSDTERGKRLRKAICDKFGFESLEFQSLEGVLEAIGIDPCKLCTYCWNGKE